MTSNVTESSELIYSRSFVGGLEGKYKSVAKFVKPNDRVLELGCADGYFGQALNFLGAKVTGVENVDLYANLARERGVAVISCDLDDTKAIEKIDGQFEIILAMDVLEHLKNPRECLVALKSKLTPNGILVVTGPNVAYWWVRLALLRGLWRYEKTGIMDETHLRFFTLDSWRDLLIDAGFSVSHVGAAETGMIPAQRWIALIFGQRLINNLAEFFTRKMPRLFACVVFMVGRKHA